MCVCSASDRGNRYVCHCQVCVCEMEGRGYSVQTQEHAGSHRWQRRGTFQSKDGRGQWAESVCIVSIIIGPLRLLIFAIRTFCSCGIEAMATTPTC